MANTRQINTLSVEEHLELKKFFLRLCKDLDIYHLVKNETYLNMLTFKEMLTIPNWFFSLPFTNNAQKYMADMYWNGIVLETKYNIADSDGIYNESLKYLVSHKIIHANPKDDWYLSYDKFKNDFFNQQKR